MKRLVIYLDGSDNDKESLRQGLRISEHLDAELSVLHLRPADQTIASVKQAIAVADQRAEVSRRAFSEICGDNASAHWLESDATFSDTIRHHGLYHDLTILERISDEEGPEVLALNTALFESGVPVFINPPTTVETCGERVAVAWGPTVQSMRALRSALPFLTRAKAVFALVNSEHGQIQESEITRYMASHGVTPQVITYQGDKLTARGRGRAILSAVNDIDADLLVMGAYGENRLRAIFGLGRATQKVVAGSPIPVLLQT